MNNASNMEYDNFLHYSSRLLMADVLGDVYVAFSKLNSPNSRFTFTRDLLRKHKMLVKTLDVDMKYDHPIVSESLRQRGNELFKAKQYKKAVHAYTKCLAVSDSNTECYALALANRSAAYFHMSEYELSLKDARWAMVSNYPSRLEYKLYERVGNAERMLGFVELAMQDYAVCLSRLDEVDMSAGEKLKFRATVKKAAAECKKVLTGHKRTKKIPRADEQLVGGKNKNIPALSAFVELGMSKNMGRGVYATRDINPGK